MWPSSLIHHHHRSAVLRAELVKVQNWCTWVKVQVTHKKATQVEVKVLKKNCTWSTSKQLYLKYTQKYFYQPKNISLARLHHVTISQAFLLVELLHINKRGVFIGAMTCKIDQQLPKIITLKNKSQNIGTLLHFEKYSPNVLCYK